MKSLDQLPQDYVLYVAKEESFDFASCCVLDPDEAEDPDGSEYDYVQENSLRYFLEISILAQVKHNLKAQVPNYSLQQLMEAVMYYFKHDAFMEV
ncbi:MAG: hypothetical protein LAT65_12185 [Saccharospirillum sp.]|nr:hypothetical protein [Saccharospirillum sp.]